MLNSKISLFTDGSVNPQSKIGFGAYLITKGDFISEVVTKEFNDTSSTRLEIETLLWALKEIDIVDTIYTDSQNIVTLPTRREKLEKNSFKNAKGKELKNATLYREFFTLLNKMNFKIVKLVGHPKNENRSELDKIFALVDIGSRKALQNK